MFYLLHCDILCSMFCRSVHVCFLVNINHKGKGKVVHVLFYLTEHDAMKEYGGMEVQLHAFLTSALERLKANVK